MQQNFRMLFYQTQTQLTQYLKIILYSTNPKILLGGFILEKINIEYL
jgi:hypothetical protein